MLLGKIVGCLTLQVVAATVLGSWMQRREFLLAIHPLYGRRLTRSEYPTLLGVVKAAQILPAGPEVRFAFMIQGEEDTTALEEAMWSESSDVFVLTFRSQRHGAFFFPQSRLAEGRNALLAAAALQEFRRGERYTYYIFLDADAVSDPPWEFALPRFFGLLRDWQPAVAVPDVSTSDLPVKIEALPRAISRFDHIFVALHSDAARHLLPYDSSLDATCWWTSQKALASVAAALFRGHVLLFPSVRVHNPNHGSYPKSNCTAEYKQVLQRFRAQAPPDAQSCFPDPVGGAEMVAMFDQLVDGRDINLPWGVATRKGAMDYTNASLAGVSCREEDVVRSLEYPAAVWLDGVPSSSWCRACSPGEAFALLKSMTAAGPYEARNWNALGVWIRFAGDWGSAAACLAIARRLLWLKGLPVDPHVEANAAQLDGLFAARLGGRPDPEQLWAGSGESLMLMIRRALHVSVHEGDSAEFMSDKTLRDFVMFMLGRSSKEIA